MTCLFILGVGMETAGPRTHNHVHVQMSISDFEMEVGKKDEEENKTQMRVRCLGYKKNEAQMVNVCFTKAKVRS